MRPRRRVGLPRCGTGVVIDDPKIYSRRRKGAFDWSTAFIAGLVAVCATVVFVREGSAHFWSVLTGDVVLFADMLPKVLAGCLIGTFVMMLLPRDLVVRLIGSESGLMGLLVATFAGFLLPGGPLTAYPVAAALLAVGADAGAAVAFLTSWTLLGYTRALVWELPFFGSDFVIWRIVIAVPLPVLAGVLARMVLRSGLIRWGDER